MSNNEQLVVIDGYLCQPDGTIPDNEVTLHVDHEGLPDGHPKQPRFECGCGHVLEYGKRRYENHLNNECVIIDQVSYYCCMNCNHRIFLAEVFDEIEKRLIAAREKFVSDQNRKTITPTT